MGSAERWMPIKGYEGSYEISDIGRVKSITRTMPHKSFGQWTIKERVLKPGKHNYSFVFLHSGGGNQKPKQIHRLVAEHYIPNPGKLPQVNHIDGNRNNNHVDNLEWCTPKQNMEHAMKHGLIEHTKDGKKVINLDTGEIFRTGSEAARKYGVTNSAILRAAQGKNEHSCGYRWGLA